LTDSPAEKGNKVPVLPRKLLIPRKKPVLVYRFLGVRSRSRRLPSFSDETIVSYRLLRDGVPAPPGR